MNQLELTINGKRYRYCGPSTYAELSPRQAVGLARLRTNLRNEPGMQIAALKLIYGIGRRQLRWLFDEPYLRYHGLEGEELTLTLAQGAALLQTINWVYDPDTTARTLIPSFRLFDYRFGSVRVLLSRLLYLRRYKGPTDGLGSLTFGEFMWADAAYRSGNHARLVAILYRPWGEGWDADRVEARAERFRSLDSGLVAAIVRQYEDALRYLARVFPAVFPRTDPGGPKAKASKSAASGWLDVSIAMAKMDVTKIGDIERTNLYLALRTLNQQIRQAEELEASLSKR